jgi:hypothetical protein
MGAVYQSKEWLDENYTVLGKSTVQLATIANCDPSTINYWLKKFGINMRTVGDYLRGRKVPEETKAKLRADPTRHRERVLIAKDWLYQQYVLSERTTYEIANDVGCKASCVQRKLKKYNIPVRSSRSRPGKKYPVSEDVRRIRKELAKKNFAGLDKSGQNNPMWGRRGSSNPQWKGGVSFEPYCHKFTKELKEEVRSEFGRKCFLCDVPENGSKLHVHHADYNKGQGCGQRWCLVPLCRSCHAKTNHHRHYYFNLLSNYWIFKYGGDALWFPD